MELWIVSLETIIGTHDHAYKGHCFEWAWQVVIVMTCAPQCWGDTLPMMNGQFNNAYDDTNDGGVGTKTQDDGIDLQTFSSQYQTWGYQPVHKRERWWTGKTKMGKPSGVSSVMHCHVGMYYVYWEIFIHFYWFEFLHNPSGLSLFLLFCTSVQNKKV